MDVARRFFRAIETPSGWYCQQGRLELDSHAGLEDAVEHLFELGRANAPSEVFAHHLDGSVVSVATFD
jgi:hypothetical protein